jgi:hypothetical protein
MYEHAYQMDFGAKADMIIGLRFTVPACLVGMGAGDAGMGVGRPGAATSEPAR